MKLFDHQKKAVTKFISNPSGFANFSEMGSGKTASAIVAACELELNRVIVVCPNTLKRNWEKEWQQWATDTWKMFIIDGSKKKRLETIKAAVEYDERCVVVVNYDALTTLYEGLCLFQGDLIIADESHYIKSHTAKRTKLLKKIPAARRWIMTGTPTPQSPLDIWSQFDFIKKDYLGKNFYVFRSVYANIYTGAGFPMVKNYKNLDRLHELTSRFSFRVLKDDCLDLPAKVYQDVEVELGPKTMKLYNQIARELVAEVAEDEYVTTPTVLTKLLRLQQITSGFVRVDDTDEIIEVGKDKMEYLKEILEGIPHEKVVIWGRFIWELKEIKKLVESMGRKAHLMIGETPEEDRHAMVEEFQRPKGNDVIVANMSVGGVGITLTESKYVVYFSRTYNYGEYIQSQDRNHRIGQKHKVTYYQLNATNTIDEHIGKILDKKQTLSDKITGDDLRRMVNGQV